MKKAAYLSLQEVNDFITWLTPLLDQPASFVHGYQQLKPKQTWQCDSLYAAYQNYQWNSAGMEATTDKLNGLSAALRHSVATGDADGCLNTCQEILAWGGVTASNAANLRAKHTAGALLPFFQLATQELAPDTVDDEAIWSQVEMNSGFTKLYALLLPDFVIYDSRVGAALGLLVRRYCEHHALPDVPKALQFAYAPARKAKGHAPGQNPRDPGTGKYRFPALRNDPVFHTRHNVRANWLLNQVLHTTRSRFNDLPPNNQLRALEAALFMVGYQVN